ncbi:2, 3 cyclic phosphodiesterase [Polyplosphaeria fusca]|uniref:2, 3 cyclic phosphodiesterase n=1 Tax=Polyplosphaeria fusca TaxID=682080 RepID=A0A9P4QWY3_9PLEO|nr:2, 3 cyclic phosphodiesterase [Polyplosphaeria fusca]
MPGSSLWLLPPDDHPLNPLLTSLIQTTSAKFASPHLFIPHVTLTSDIPPSTYASSAQKWLHDLPLPAAKDVAVKLGKLQSEDVFVRKLYSKVDKAGVKEIGAAARMVVEGYADWTKALEWAEESYNPHVSLLYHDCPPVSDKDVAEMEKMVAIVGVSLEGEGELGSWLGGRVVLVETDKPISAWAPIAERTL